MQEQKQLVILGSTGSIGTQTLDIVRRYKDQFRVLALAAHSNIQRLEEQAREFAPRFIAVYDSDKASELKKRISKDIEVITGMDALCYLATHAEASLIVMALTGSIGIEPTYYAAKSGQTIALANKESLVAAGELIIQTAHQSGAKIIPIDSEHSALFQCLHKEHSKCVHRLILTASGGPFLNKSKEELLTIRPSDALKHPNWNMGKKVTIDSSTLMNKGLEVIEAYWLFGIPAKQIDVLVHPQSLVHSMVEYCDGSIIMQMAGHDMKLPIQYALTYPERYPCQMDYFDVISKFELTFEPPDFNQFKCLKLAYSAIEEGGSMPCFMNGANEILVERFLNGEISWKEIPDLLEDLMASHRVIHQYDLDMIKQVDLEAKRRAQLLEGVCL